MFACRDGLEKSGLWSVQVKVAVRSSSLRRARLPSSSSFPGFSRCHSQALPLALPPWCGRRCKWEPYLRVWLAWKSPPAEEERRKKTHFKDVWGKGKWKFRSGVKEGTEISLIVNTGQNPVSVAVVSKRRNPQVWYERKETGKVDSHGYWKQVLQFQSSPPPDMQVDSKVLRRTFCDHHFRRELFRKDEWAFRPKCENWSPNTTKQHQEEKKKASPLHSRPG